MWNFSRYLPARRARPGSRRTIYLGSGLGLDSEYYFHVDGGDESEAGNVVNGSVDFFSRR